jgi:predicted enzyme related to lactoylglutathione lyase
MRSTPLAEGIKAISYPVRDFARAKILFSALLGTEPYLDEPDYAGFSAGGQDVGLDPHGHSKGTTGPVGHWHVNDINSGLQALLAAGAGKLQGVQEAVGGKLTASGKDTDGNVIGLLQPA